MDRTIICIACPRGCKLSVSGNIDHLVITGNQCKKGINYGKQEVIEPLRMLTTTVKTSHPVYRRLPVRLSCEIPLEQIKIFMNAINQVSITKGCKPGELVAENLLGSDVDLVATGGVCFEEG